MKKLMLEALAAWLALAAVYGQACAAMQTGANRVSTIASRGTGLSIADNTDIVVSLLKVTANVGPSANAAVALLTSPATDQSGTRTRLTNGVRAPATNPFGSADARPSNAASGFSLPVADDFTFRRKNLPVADVKRRTFDRRDVAAFQEVFVPANVGSVRIKTIRTVRNDDSEAATVSLLPGPKLVPETMVVVPEPGSWATALAGLLGVIAIARRRMSL
ncbi:MAG TPA: PEP-CTERM sorting domain-containing protein [Burkholderiales bacterium]|nr:PEP-CTERM sorting domain-containing protein [Burkholderiales bacterium]